MPFVNVGNEESREINLYYEDHGSGPAVVLINGYLRGDGSYEMQVEALLATGHRVITYDCGGLGKSIHPAIGDDEDTFSRDLSKLVAQLKLRDFALVGFSIAGREVARYLRTHGSKGVSKVAFISPVPPCLLKTADKPDGVDGSVFDGIKKAVGKDRYALFGAFFRNFYSADFLLDKRFSEQTIPASWKVAVSCSAIAGIACVETAYEDFRRDLIHVHVPMLVIHVDADRDLPIYISGRRAVRLVKPVRLLEVQDGQNYIRWSHADEVNAALVSFLGDWTDKRVVPDAQTKAVPSRAPA